MVRKLKRLLQSSWIRRSCVLMSCALILICSVSPAFAAGLTLDEDGQTRQWSWLSGTVIPRIKFGSYSSSEFQYSTTFDFGNYTANLPITGDNYIAERANNFHNWDSSDHLDYSLKTQINLSRRKQEVYLADGTSRNFDRIRYRFDNSGYFSDLFEDVNEEPINTYFYGWDIHIDPFFVEYSDSFFNNLLKLRLDQSCLVEVELTYSFVYQFSDGSKQLIVDHKNGGEIRGYSNIDSVPVFTLLGDTFIYDGTLYSIPTGTPILVSDIVIKTVIDPFVADQAALAIQNNDFEFEILSCQFKVAQPDYFSEHPVSDFMDYADEFIHAPAPPVPPDFSAPNPFTQWLASVVSGFFDVEIMPGFSLGGVMAAIIAVVVILLLLKFFSGG